MNPSRLQRWIDRLDLVSPQRWMLIASSLLAAVGASAATAFVTGHQNIVVLVLIIAFAVVAVIEPDSHAALVAELVIVWQWLAATDDLTSAWTIAVSVCLFAFHTLIALMAVTPISATIDLPILTRWARRSGLVVGSVVATWLLVVVMDDRQAPGNATLSFVGFVTLAVLVLMARAHSASSDS